MGNRWDGTTPTDTRSQRSRTSRRGGQLLTRARSPLSKNGLPIRVPRRPLFRTVTPYARLETPSQQNNTRTLASFHTGYQCGGVVALPAAEDHQKPRSFPQRRGGGETALAGDPRHRRQAGQGTSQTSRPPQEPAQRAREAGGRRDSAALARRLRRPQPGLSRSAGAGLMITAQPMIGKAHTAGFLHLGQSRGLAAAVNLLTSRGCREGLTAASTGTQSTAEEPRPNHKINNPVYTEDLSAPSDSEVIVE